MISTFTAFIDANVFYGARLRSLMICAAQTKLFRARWSDEVHDEWIRNLLIKRPDLRPEDLERTRTQMNAAVPDCLVTGYEPLIGGIHLPDLDDRHVVAAAIMTRANVIVTFDRRHFPIDLMMKFRLHSKDPDDFLTDLLNLSSSIFIDAVREDFRHYKAPPLKFEQYVKSLRKAGVPKLADALAPLRILFENGDD